MDIFTYLVEADQIVFMQQFRGNLLISSHWQLLAHLSPSFPLSDGALSLKHGRSFSCSQLHLPLHCPHHTCVFRQLLLLGLHLVFSSAITKPN